MYRGHWQFSRNCATLSQTGNVTGPPPKSSAKEPTVKPRNGNEEGLRCSFCHKQQDAVAKLISSPSDYPRAYICDECVAVCNSILEDDRSGDASATNPTQ